MKRNHKSTKAKSEAIQVWTLAQAQAAVPYITSILRSMREHALDVQRFKLTVEKLAKTPGRPTRDAIIAEHEAKHELNRAEQSFQEAVDELQALDVYTLDPIRAQALVPFVFDEQLAWYVFDLFDGTPIRFWRLQSDSEETRRPITSKQHGVVPATVS